MTFSVRQPDGALTPVILSDTLIASSVVIGCVVIFWAWLSACCEYHATQGGNSARCDQCSVTTILFFDQPTSALNQNSNESEDSMWMIILTGVIAFAAWRTWLVYAQLRDHNKAIERAYVYVHQVASFENFAIGARPVVLLTVVNSGHTPGWILESSAATIPVADVAKHLPRPMPVEQIGLRNQKQVVFAGVKTEWGHILGPVQESEYTNVKNGAWRLVVFGRIHYRDTFNDRHYTDFSFVWDRFKEGKSGPSDFLIHPDGYTDAT